MLNAEKATYTPAVFLTTGGMSNKVADLIARKRKERSRDAGIPTSFNLGGEQIHLTDQTKVLGVIHSTASILTII